MRQKILFFAVNSRFSHSCLSLFYLRSIIRDLDFSTQIQEYSINDRIEDLIFSIYQLKPDVLVLSVYIWNKSFILQLSRDLKKILPDLIIVGGGPDLSYLDDYTSDLNEFDFIIRGPGERVFYELASANFDKKLICSDYKHSSDQPLIIEKQNYQFSDIPFPYEDSDIDNFKHKYLYYESSRSCPFQCSYCLSSRNDQKLEYKELSKVKEELSRLISYHLNIVKFVDRSFNVNMDFAKEVWRFLIQQSTKTKFHFEVHPDYIDEEMLEILKTAPKDLFQFEIGIQSVNAETLNAVKRYSNWEIVKETLKKLLEVKNVHYHLDQIAGLPYEDYPSLKHSFNEIFSLKPDHYQMGILKVLRGTEMYECQKKYGLIYSNREPYQIFSTFWLQYQELMEYQGIDHVIDILYNSKHFNNFFNFVFMYVIDYYQFFVSLSRFFEFHHISKKEKNYIHIVSVLHQFINDLALDKDQEQLLQDALLFDWGVLSNSHFYPEGIDTSRSDHFRENCWHKIKESRKGEAGVVGDHKLELSVLRKAKFFTAQNQKFYQFIDWQCYQVIYNNEDMNDENIEGIVIISKDRLIVWKEKL